MTEELRQRANCVHKQIADLEAQIQIVEDMHHVDNSLTLAVDTIGAITIAWDDELKDDIIDMVLRRLNQQKEAKEDEYRML